MEYYPCYQNETPAWDEFVVFESPQAPPRFWVELENDFPTALPDPESIWLEQANLGNPVAQYKVGITLFKKDQFKEAVAWFKESAVQDCAPGCYCLAVCFEQGKEVEQDDGKAFQLFHKAALEGLDAAQYQIGEYYENGLGVALNQNEAVKWYLKASEQGYPEAQSAMGRCLKKGIGIAANSQESIKCYQKAAEQGEASAHST